MIFISIAVIELPLSTIHLAKDVNQTLAMISDLQL